MIDTIYIEADILEHPRTQNILARYPQARQVMCERYGEVFNRKGQSFRTQKINPSLILARKHQNFVLPAPDDYGVGGTKNYYFSYMMNCLYDCRYCFLQGMYRSAHYVVFVNYENFSHAIEETFSGSENEQTWFFSGYDCDSLAMEPITGFAEYMLSTFPTHHNAWLELRTKSTQVRFLLNRPVHENTVVAFSLSPQEIIDALEHKTPSLQNRLQAAKKLQQAGWKLGLRFDPIIYHPQYQRLYQALFEAVFAQLEGKNIHSVSLGGFRLPEGFFKNMIRLYPYEPLFAGPLDKTTYGMMGYEAELEAEMLAFCEEKILQHICPEVYFPCTGET